MPSLDAMSACTKAATIGLISLLVAVLAACTSASSPSSTPKSPAASPGLDWSAQPERLDGLVAVASVDGTTFAVHTASGDKIFLPGINLGSTTPLHQPGELAIARADYRRWFAQMGELGIRAVRIYTIHPPAFYDELAAYNRAHPTAPLYLVQGVYLPDESAVEGGTWYDEPADRALTAELADASAAVHGDLTRDPTPGRASGQWRADVTPWLVAWIVGVEWDPQTTARTDRKMADAPPTRGRYFRSTPDATPTERWIARHLDELAGHEVARGSTAPMAFVNWPTTDPLDHPDEPLVDADLVGVDANHVQPTNAWPGGTFASFHAYPYYPDFMHLEPGLQRARWDGRKDAYAGYLRALKRHFPTMPVMVSEVGVPSSLGSAHRGINGRDQGNHTEQQAMQTDADLVRLIHGQGLAGALVFEWSDEWFKRTWNTLEHQLGERRQLWHDPLTNEQFFGVVATDSAPLPDVRREDSFDAGDVATLGLDADGSYLYADVGFRSGTPDRVELGFDVVPELSGPDYRVVVDPSAGIATAYVRAELDPIRLDTHLTDYQPDVGKSWHEFRQLISRELETQGGRLEPQFHDVGALVEGSWNPDDADYDSLATWQVSSGGDDLRVRLPWAMIGFADPSSRTVLGPGVPATLSTVDQIAVAVTTGATGSADAAAATGATMLFTWPTWNYLEHTERLKPGADVLAKAFRDLAP